MPFNAKQQQISNTSPTNRCHTHTSIMPLLLLLAGYQDDNDSKPLLESDKELEACITSSQDDIDAMSYNSISDTISSVNSLDCNVKVDINGGIIVT